MRMIPVTDLEASTYLTRKCNVEGCWNLCASGYTCCPGHIWGFNERIPSEVISYIKKNPKLLEKLENAS